MGETKTDEGKPFRERAEQAGYKAPRPKAPPSGKPTVADKQAGRHTQRDDTGKFRPRRPSA